MSHWLADVFFGFAASFAMTMGVLNWVAWRRYRALDKLLQELCVNAWVMRRWPLIDQWLEYAGLEMRVKQRGQP